MELVKFADVLAKAVATPKTIAASWGQQTLEEMFAPILATPIAHFCLDSRKADEGCAFVLLVSSSLDRARAAENANRYIQALQARAGVIISEFSLDELQLADVNIPVISVPKIRQILGDLIAARLQLHRAVDLPSVIAVTGTNGKTTVSQLVAQLCQLSGVSSAIMGTAGNGRLGQLVQSSNTTGDVLMVHEFLHQMACEGVQVVALEASSHGLDQHRLQGVPVKVAIYTNLSHDHLDYHADMQDYCQAKRRLFDPSYFPTLQAGVINQDAQYPLFDAKPTQPYPLIHYSQTQATAEYYAKDISPSLQGVSMTVVSQEGEMAVVSPLLGMFNVDNLLASMAAFSQLYPAQTLNLPTWVAKLQGARGRMQRATSQTGCFIVDYAHTPDALVQVLSSLRKHCTGRLIAVFGCGGDRDKTKRPLMTRAGLDYADAVILTADNPRSESVSAILSDMQQGLGCEDHYKISIEPDRKIAIAAAVQMAKADDIVVIAGKGHETYQEINGVKHDFDDLAVLEAALQQFGK